MASSTAQMLTTCGCLDSRQVDHSNDARSFSLVPGSGHRRRWHLSTPHQDCKSRAPADGGDEDSDPARMDPISLIRPLGQLRDEGFSSDEAFEAKKAEILGRL